MGMGVNLRKKYSGKKDVSAKRRAYKFQLDYFLAGKRIRETIKEVEILPTDTKEIRDQKLRIINKIKADLEIDLANQSNGIISRKLKKASFIDFFRSLGNTKEPNTKVAWENTLKHIIRFQGKKLTFENITEDWLEKFSKFLLKEVSQNSARTYLQKISTALNQAVKLKIISHNPYHHISPPKKEEIEMVFLEKAEIKKLIETDFYNDEVKNAFLFGCYTGLRFSDIQSLKWDNIKNNRLHITQKKTKSLAVVPMNINAQQILDLQSLKSNNQNVFNLFEANSSVNRTLRKLIQKADIKKNVSFHSSRHTFATLLISSGANIYTVSKLLGHKDIKSTLVYAKVIDEEKENAVNSMPLF